MPKKIGGLLVLVLLVVILFFSISSQKESAAFASKKIDQAKLISLAPNITEIICYLGGAERLLGVTNDCNYPPEAVRSCRWIGKYTYPDLEKIIILQPATVLAEKTIDPRFLKALQEHKIKYHLYDFKHLETFFTELKRLNKDLALPGAQKIIGLENIYSNYESKGKNQKIIIIIWQKPFMIAGQDVFISRYFEHLGYKNMIAKNSYSSVDPEIFFKDPEAVYINLSGQKFSLPVKNIVIEDLDQDILLRLSPRLIKYYEKLRF